MTTRGIVTDLLGKAELDHRFNFLRQVISSAEFKFMPTEGESEVWHLEFMLSNRRKSLAKIGCTISGVEELLAHLATIKNKMEIIDSCGFTDGYLVGSIYVQRYTKSIIGYTCVDTKDRPMPTD